MSFRFNPVTRSASGNARPVSSHGWASGQKFTTQAERVDPVVGWTSAAEERQIRNEYRANPDPSITRPSGPYALYNRGRIAAEATKALHVTGFEKDAKGNMFANVCNGAMCAAVVLTPVAIAMLMGMVKGAIGAGRTRRAQRHRRATTRKNA